MSKSGKSFGQKLLSILIGIIMLVALLAIALYCVLYFCLGIESFSLIQELKILSEPIVEEEFITNGYTDTDLSNIQAKLDTSGELPSRILLSDKEIAAYANDSISNNDDSATIKVFDSDINLVGDNGLIAEITFTNIPNSITSNTLFTLDIVLRLDLTEIKESMNNFPANIVKDKIPNTIYINSVVNVTKNNNPNAEYEYSLQSSEMKINKLNTKQTKDIYNILNKIASLGDFDEFNLSLSQPIIDAMIGNTSNPGLYYSMKPYATAYSFENNESGNYFVLYTIDTTITKNITYTNTKGASNTNQTTYNITDNTITLLDISANGYTFLGWYDEGDNKVTSFDSNIMTDVTFEARWEIITYTITYNLKGGSVSSPNPTEYTIETPTFTLTNPTKALGDFAGWLGTNISSLTDTVTVTQGTFGDLTFVANWEGDTVTITLHLNNALTKDITMYGGVPINEDEFNEKFNPSSLNMSGYSVNKWYTNSNKTIEYDFDTNLMEDLDLYGNWEYITNKIYFYDYLQEFEDAQISKEIHFNNRNELIAYIDYVKFYEVTNEVDNYVKLYLDYISKDFSLVSTEINNAKSEYDNISSYISDSTFIIGSAGTQYSPYGIFYFNSSTTANWATITADPSKQYVEEQQDYALRIKPNTLNKRNNDYNNFKINNVPYTIDVTTSEQLFYVMEQGYKPNCITSSPAETIYTLAKATLREICDDTMTDVEKLRAIYEWLALEVQYDKYAASLSLPANQLRTYKSWSPEGVFIDKVAVCEGIAKSFTILSRIEGIPAVYVTSNTHAWNKVLLDGKWYGIDATHGSPSVSGIEVLTYTSFLFTDAYKEDGGEGDITNTYPEFVANTEYDIYSNYTLNNETVDLVINSQAEFNNIVAMALTYSSSYNCTYITFQVILDGTNLTQLLSEAIHHYPRVDNKYISNNTTSGDTVYTIYINK